MDISTRNKGIGAWSSKVAAIDCWRTLKNKMIQFFVLFKKKA